MGDIGGVVSEKKPGAIALELGFLREDMDHLEQTFDRLLNKLQPCLSSVSKMPGDAPTPPQLAVLDVPVANCVRDIRGRMETLSRCIKITIAQVEL